MPDSELNLVEEEFDPIEEAYIHMHICLLLRNLSIKRLNGSIENSYRYNNELHILAICNEQLQDAKFKYVMAKFDNLLKCKCEIKLDLCVTNVTELGNKVDSYKAKYTKVNNKFSKYETKFDITPGIKSIDLYTSNHT